MVMYATPSCGVCVKAKVFFEKHKIAYKEYDITKDQQARKRFNALNGRGVPLILVGKHRIAGFNERALRNLLRSEEGREMAKNLAKLRAMTPEELDKEETALRETVWKLRLQRTTGCL